MPGAGRLLDRSSRGTRHRPSGGAGARPRNGRRGRDRRDRVVRGLDDRGRDGGRDRGAVAPRPGRRRSAPGVRPGGSPAASRSTRIARGASRRRAAGSTGSGGAGRPMPQQRPEGLGIAQRGQGDRGDGLAAGEIVPARLGRGVVDALGQHAPQEGRAPRSAAPPFWTSARALAAAAWVVGSRPGSQQTPTSGGTRSRPTAGPSSRSQRGCAPGAPTAGPRTAWRPRPRPRVPRRTRLERGQRAGGAEPRARLRRRVPDHPMQPGHPGRLRVRGQDVADDQDLLGLAPRVRRAGRTAPPRGPESAGRGRAGPWRPRVGAAAPSRPPPGPRAAGGRCRDRAQLGEVSRQVPVIFVQAPASSRDSALRDSRTGDAASSPRTAPIATAAAARVRWDRVAAPIIRRSSADQARGPVNPRILSHSSSEGSRRRTGRSRQYAGEGRQLQLGPAASRLRLLARQPLADRRDEVVVRELIIALARGSPRRARGAAAPGLDLDGRRVDGRDHPQLVVEDGDQLGEVVGAVGVAGGLPQRGRRPQPALEVG